MIERRNFMLGASLLPWAARLAASPALASEAVPFSRSVVIERARALAAKPFAWPDPPLTDDLKSLSYSQYQGIRFREDRRLFTEPPTGFSVDLFHSGFIFNVPVEIFVVHDGTSKKLDYDPELFTFQLSAPPAADTPLEFGGFRVRTAINRPDVMDEFLVFAGASYFRAVSKDQIYGLSARGLAVNTADEQGEEFPFFRAHWLEVPGEGRLIVHSLLDGPSASGAFRFTVRPGEVTRIDVEATIFARAEMSHIGLAPLTSMFLYDAKDRSGHDDFRPAIHDSDGLAIQNGQGEWLWRPLHAPRLLQISGFADNGPRGFGLIQRERRIVEYEDFEALYHRRPSAWIEPVGDWGKGKVMLVEIPTADEIHDNIVAYWRPDQPLAAGEEMSFTYRMHWNWDLPVDTDRLRVTRTLSGRGAVAGWRKFVVDFTGKEGHPLPVSGLRHAIQASVGSIQNAVLFDNPDTGGVRVAFELDPAGNDVVELRLELLAGDSVVSDVWVYRWSQ